MDVARLKIREQLTTKRESLFLRMDLLSATRARARAKFEGKMYRKIDRRAKI